MFTIIASIIILSFAAVHVQIPASAQSLEQTLNPKPMFVSFDVTNGTAECPTGEIVTKVQSHAHNAGFRDVIFTTSPFPEHTGSFSKDGDPGGYSPYFFISWGNVSSTTDTYHLTGVLSDRHRSICPYPHAEHFEIVIRGSCSNDTFAMTTPNPNGYSITASGDNVNVVCMHP